MNDPLKITSEEKEKIRKQHEQLEKQNRQRKENLKNGVAFKKKTDE